MPRRRKDRVDANQNEIVDALRKMGFSVELGHDDCLVGINGLNFWYEIKNPNKISKTGKIHNLKKSQKDLLRDWKGHYKIVSSLDEILDDIKTRIEQWQTR